MMRYETTLNLNSSELNILLSALQLMDLRDEIQLAREHGSVPALYNKLYGELETISTTKPHTVYELGEHVNESSF